MRIYWNLMIMHISGVYENKSTTFIVFNIKTKTKTYNSDSSVSFIKILDFVILVMSY